MWGAQMGPRPHPAALLLRRLLIFFSGTSWGLLIMCSFAYHGYTRLRILCQNQTEILIAHNRAQQKVQL